MRLSLVVPVVLAAVDIENPVEGGPLSGFSRSFLSWSALKTNCVPIGSLADAAAAVAWASSSLSSSTSRVCSKTRPKDAIDLSLDN